MARECTLAWGPSVSVFSSASDGSSDESDHAMEQSSPSPSIVASVPVSAQRTPSCVPRESGHVMEELPRSSPKAPAVSAPVSVPAQSVTVSAVSATVTVSASPVIPFLSLLSCLLPLLPLRTCSCYSYRFLCYDYRYCSYYSYCACSYL